MKQDKMWDYLQNDASESFLGNHGRLRYVKKYLNAQKNDKVLTIGPGDFYLEEKLLESGVDLFCLDPSEKSIKKAKEECRLEEKAKVGYSQNIPFGDQVFDCVVMSEVLEHLDDEVRAKTISEVHRVLKEKGIFVGTVPFKENLSSSIAVCPNCTEVFHRVGHLKSFDERALSDQLQSKFTKNEIKVRYLPNWRILNIRGRIIAFIKASMAIMGVPGAKCNLIFKSTKLDAIDGA